MKRPEMSVEVNSRHTALALLEFIDGRSSVKVRRTLLERSSIYCIHPGFDENFLSDNLYCNLQSD